MLKKAAKSPNKSSKKNKILFWRKLPRPFFVLAPMANVTDAAMRKMIASFKAPDVTWTEFVSADGLVSPGKDRLLMDLTYSPKERPIVAQLFSSKPEKMKEAAKLVAELGHDGVDINMGCPDRAVERGGAGASLMKNPKLAMELVQAAREGWHEAKSKSGVIEARGLPITVKTRIGYSKEEIDTWISGLLRLELPALTVHLRTRKELSEVPAHWDLMPRIVALRDQIQADLPKEERTLIIGNGDVASLSEAREKCEKYGCDGVMIGRGIFGKPWFFADEEEKSPEFRLKTMMKHATLFEKYYGKKGSLGHKNFDTMKKHFKAYVSGWDGAKELRVKLMETENAKGVGRVVSQYLRSCQPFLL